MHVRHLTFPAALLAAATLLAGLFLAARCESPDRRGGTVYVDYKVRSSRCTTYDPATRACSRGKQTVYRTLAAAARAAVAGQTVVIREGVYCEQLRPGRSGEPGRPITFKNYGGEKVQITGPALTPAVDLSDRSHVVIEGLEVTNVRRWLYAIRSHHNVIRKNRFSKALEPGHSSKTGLFFQQASFNRILDNVIEDSTEDNLSLIMSDRNLVAGNVFRKAYHTLWAIKGGNFNVLRGNHFHNELQKIGEVYDCHDVGFDHEFFAYNCTKHNLIEGNVFAYTPSSGQRSPYAGIQYAGQDGIIRSNVFRDTVGPGLSLTLYGREANFNTGNHVYNNVFYGSQLAGVRLAGSTEFAFAANVLKNNILAGSRFVAHDRRWTWYTRDLAGKPVQLLAGRLDGFVCQNNNFHGGKGDDPHLITLGWRNPLVRQQRPVAWLQANHPKLFRDNTVLDPLFVDAAKRDFRLKPTSPMIDRGAFLTRTVGPGSGVAMPVEDVGYFFDGYDIPGETGDLIQLAGQARTGRVVDIDYRRKVLVLSQSLTWKGGQGVALRYLGRGPDVGAHEFVPGGDQPPVAAFTAAPKAGNDLAVDLDASGSTDPDGRIARYDWDFGDGRRAPNAPAKTSHTYAGPGVYEVTLKVTDDGGRVLTGVAGLAVSVGRPVLAVEPAALDFGATTASLPLRIRNAGQGTLDYRLSAPGPWLSVEPRAGRCTTGTDAVTVRVNRKDLPPGTYAGVVAVSAGPGRKRDVPVTMRVPRLRTLNLIEPGDLWRFRKGTTAAPKGWASTDFDDSAWLEGPSGIGYGTDVKYATVLKDMRGNYISVYMRRRFRIDDPASVVSLEVALRYDDGFVAYLNGTELARSRSMGPPGTPVRFDRGAISKHDEEAPEESHVVPVTPELRLGADNVLAVEFHNEWIKGTDAGAIPRLRARLVDERASAVGAEVPLVLGLFAGGGAATLGLWSVRRRRKRRPPDRTPRGPEAPSRERLRQRRWQVLNWTAVAVTVAAIVVLSHCPRGLLSLGGHDRKVHAAAYGLLALLLFRAIGGRGRAVRLLSAALRAVDRRVGLIKLAVVVAVVALIGMVTELTQPLVGRQRSLTDLLADFAGAALAAVLWMAKRALTKRRD